jgi:hypothetical protein
MEVGGELQRAGDNHRTVFRLDANAGTRNNRLMARGQAKECCRQGSQANGTTFHR